MTGRLEHVNITVADARKTADFLCELFDWHIRWEGTGSDGGLWLHVGSKTCYLAVHTPVKPIKASGQGYDVLGRLNHVGIIVDDLAPIEAKVVKAGFQTYNFGEYDPGKRFYFTDADGVEFEIVSYA